MLNSGASVQVVVTPLDLKEFMLNTIEEYKKTQEIVPESDERLYPQDVRKMLGKSISTLWRWKKSGYLKPKGYIGGTPYYLKSQIDSLIKS